jgi:diketogulonate reductase-like aldo/keto reductase
VELERYILLVLHVTLVGLANRLLKDTVDYADLVVKRTPVVLKTARLKQIEASHKHETIKQEILDWGIQNGPTLANMHLAQGHLDAEQIQVDGELNEEEREAAILKKRKTELLQRNTAAKVEVAKVEKETGKYSKPIWQGFERMLAKDCQRLED